MDQDRVVSLILLLERLVLLWFPVVSVYDTTDSIDICIVHVHRNVAYRECPAAIDPEARQQI